MADRYGIWYQGGGQSGGITSHPHDILEITAPSTGIVHIHEVHLTQATEAGDAQDEMLLVRMQRRVGATSGSGGTGTTPAPLEAGDPAMNAVWERFNTTAATSGTATDMWVEAFNVRQGFHWVVPPERSLVLSPSQMFLFQFVLPSPADAITWNAVVVASEIDL